MYLVFLRSNNKFKEIQRFCYSCWGLINASVSARHEAEIWFKNARGKGGAFYAPPSELKIFAECPLSSVLQYEIIQNGSYQNVMEIKSEYNN